MKLQRIWILIKTKRANYAHKALKESQLERDGARDLYIYL